MENLPLGRIAALVPEFAVKDLPLGRTLMMMILKFKNGSDRKKIIIYRLFFSKMLLTIFSFCGCMIHSKVENVSIVDVAWKIP